MKIEPGTFTPLGYTTTGGMEDECLRCNVRLKELIANKKCESKKKRISHFPFLELPFPRFSMFENIKKLKAKLKASISI